MMITTLIMKLQGLKIYQLIGTKFSTPLGKFTNLRFSHIISDKMENIKANIHFLNVKENTMMVEILHEVVIMWYFDMY